MNKLQVLLPLLFLIAFSSYAQKGKLTPFRIEGSINADSGKLTLFFNSDYNLAEQKILISDVKERKFSFSGYIPESQSVFVILDDVYRSGEFIIDPGKQEISINIDSVDYVPFVSNKTMRKEYPDFSDELKKGYAGSVLKQKIYSGKQIAVGTLFPSISISDMEDRPFSTEVFRENKLTLVEFWYSRCGPCRALFPSMRNLHKKFNSKGFEIIGISVDENEQRIYPWKNWRNT